MFKTGTQLPVFSIMIFLFDKICSYRIFQVVFSSISFSILTSLSLR